MRKIARIRRRHWHGTLYLYLSLWLWLCTTNTNTIPNTIPGKSIEMHFIRWRRRQRAVAIDNLDLRSWRMGAVVRMLIMASMSMMWMLGCHSMPMSIISMLSMSVIVPMSVSVGECMMSHGTWVEVMVVMGLKLVRRGWSLSLYRRTLVVAMMWMRLYTLNRVLIMLVMRIVTSVMRLRWMLIVVIITSRRMVVGEVVVVIMLAVRVVLIMCMIEISADTVRWVMLIAMFILVVPSSSIHIHIHILILGLRL